MINKLYLFLIKKNFHKNDILFYLIIKPLGKLNWKLNYQKQMKPPTITIYDQNVETYYMMSESCYTNCKNSKNPEKENVIKKYTMDARF